MTSLFLSACDYYYFNPLHLWRQREKSALFFPRFSGFWLPGVGSGARPGRGRGDAAGRGELGPGGPPRAPTWRRAPAPSSALGQKRRARGRGVGAPRSECSFQHRETGARGGQKSQPRPERGAPARPPHPLTAPHPPRAPLAGRARPGRPRGSASRGGPATPSRPRAPRPAPAPAPARPAARICCV